MKILGFIFFVLIIFSTIIFTIIWMKGIFSLDIVYLLIGIIGLLKLDSFGKRYYIISIGNSNILEKENIENKSILKLNKKNLKKVEELKDFLYKLDKNKKLNIDENKKRYANVKYNENQVINISTGTISSHSLSALKFIIGHELGHLNLNHGSKKRFIFQDLLFIIFGEIFEKMYIRYLENQADEYSIMIQGNKKSLRKIWVKEYVKIIKKWGDENANKRKTIKEKIYSTHPMIESRMNGKTNLIYL